MAEAWIAQPGCQLHGQQSGVTASWHVSSRPPLLGQLHPCISHHIKSGLAAAGELLAAMHLSLALLASIVARRATCGDPDCCQQLLCSALR